MPHAKSTGAYFGVVPGFDRLTRVSIQVLDWVSIYSAELKWEDACDFFDDTFLLRSRKIHVKNNIGCNIQNSIFSSLRAKSSQRCMKLLVQEQVCVNICLCLQNSRTLNYLSPCIAACVSCKMYFSYLSIDDPKLSSFSNFYWVSRKVTVRWHAQMQEVVHVRYMWMSTIRYLFAEQLA